MSTIDQKMLYSPEVSHSKIKYDLPVLSEREIEVLGLMKKNKTADEIIAILEITNSTLKHHKNNLLNKLNAPNIIVAIENASLLGLLTD